MVRSGRGAIMHRLSGLWMAPAVSQPIRMTPFLYRCPTTGQNVQGFFADDGSENGGETYETVTCLACRLVHLINPKTGRILGIDED